MHLAIAQLVCNFVYNYASVLLRQLSGGLLRYSHSNYIQYLVEVFSNFGMENQKDFVHAAILFLSTPGVAFAYTFDQSL